MIRFFVISRAFFLFFIDFSCSSQVVTSQVVTSQFVTSQNGRFILDGKSFRYGGTNTYYLHYSSQMMVQSALQHSVDNNFTVIRMWTWLDGQFCNSSSPWGFYYQCRDAVTNAIYVNTSAFEHIDFVISEASKRGLRLVLTFTNNWKDFGGIDMYVQWRKDLDPSFVPTHDAFYSDNIIKGWYKNWIKSIVTRTNTITGLKYIDDPTIFSWQLVNEPRCSGSGNFPASKTCGTQAGTPLPAWVKEMSDYIRTIDQAHMISVGDEGFACLDNGSCPNSDWWCDCSTGVSSSLFVQSPQISYMTAHLYPESWGQNWEWGNWWIQNHTLLAHSFSKPFVIEEFGISSKTLPQHVIYTNWTDTIIKGSTDGFQFWMNIGIQDNGEWYLGKDGDILNIACKEQDDPAIPTSNDEFSCNVLSTAAKNIAE